jgi:HEPN domain-containing protein
MAIPRSKDARLFYRCAFQRFEESQVLFRADFTTGAVYLAGYAVECILKALILSAVTHKKADSVLQSFRGQRAHDYQWLRSLCFPTGGARFPTDVKHCFTLVDRWSTEMRYSPLVLKIEDADSFLKAADVILRWADGRP